MTNDVQPSGLDIPTEDQLFLGPLFDDQAMLGLLQKYGKRAAVDIVAVHITHVRYQPRVSCLAGMELRCRKASGGEDFSLRLYVKHLKADAFGLAQERTRRGPWSPGRILDSPLSCPQTRCLLFEFPNDARLPGLPLVLQPEELTTLLQKPALQNHGTAADHVRVNVEEMPRYKPENRCVVKAEALAADLRVTGAYAIRIERPKRAAATMERLRNLPVRISGTEAPEVARPFLLHAKHGITAVPWVDGEPLSRRMNTDGVQDLLFRTGAALACLHGTKVTGLGRMEPGHHLRRMNRTTEFLLAGYPSCSGMARNLKRDLIRLAADTRPAHPGLVHGDFHQGQVVISGPRIWFLDMDGIGIAETALDIGNFLAQLHVLQLKGNLSSVSEYGNALLAGYDSLARVPADPRRLAYWTALGLLELAAKQLRRLRAGWSVRVDHLLTAIGEVIP
jgi:aminoglycoside phosphotransferase (APT) family kinase protein